VPLETDRAVAEVTDVLERVSAAIPGGGEHRPGQIEMAQLVTRAIERGQHLVVQAGTGTGKSLAYLLPAVLSGRRVVIATVTKALQDQLMKKDLPFLAQQLGQEHDFTFAVLKGRSNYVCRQRVSEIVSGESTSQSLRLEEPALEVRGARGSDSFWDQALGAGGRDPAGGAPTGQAGFSDELRRIIAWAEDSQTGERSELEFEPNPRAWAAVSVGAMECPGAFQCPSGARCFAENARTLAAASQVVVVNTHLYATHVASKGLVLHEHDVLVLDEAHAVEDVMTAALGVELSAGRLRAAATMARSLLEPDDARLSDGVLEVGDQLEESLRPLAGRRLLELSGSDLDRVLELARTRLAALDGALHRAGEDDGGRRTRALLVTGHLLEDLNTISTAGDDQVTWVESDGPSARSPTLKLSPVEIGSLLAERIWPNVTSVLTSATIPPMLETRLGLPSSETELADVGSPFPYERCALLYCPVDLPDRRSPLAETAVHDELERIINAAKGRTLALFTSWRAMTGAVDALRGRVSFVLLAQNDLPKQKLLEAFAEEESACLFATMSFWQGVDVPGTTLSVVTIDRLPFPRPDDPLLQARRERAGDGAFRTVDLPKAAMLLAQGAGRLIRSSTDRGLVAVLDRRLVTAGYGRLMRQALPPMPFTTRRRDAMEFLASIGSDSTESVATGSASDRGAGGAEPPGGDQ
jgi:ATP-dependent DNA helicase DinG